MSDNDKRVLSFEEIEARIYAEAERLELETYAVEVLVDVRSLDKTLQLRLVPASWKAPFTRCWAEIEFHYGTDLTTYANDPTLVWEDCERLSAREFRTATQLDVEVRYHLIGPYPPVPLENLEAHVRPCLAALNRVHRRRGPVVYTVSTDYKGRNDAHEAFVEEMHATSAVEDEFDMPWLREIARGLAAVGPLAGVPLLENA